MKAIIFGLVTVMLLSVSTLSYAEDKEYNLLDKFTRGFENIILSPIEIGHGIGQARQQGAETASVLPSGGIDSAIGWGPLNGACRMLTRAFVGIYEVITFPIPSYKPILKNIDEEGFFL